MICYDEGLKQLIAETWIGLPAKSGQVECYDYEYQRNGVRNLNMFFEPLIAKRHVRLTERHTMHDFAHHCQWLVDELHPEADLIRVVLVTSIPTNRKRCTKPFHPQKPAAFSRS